MSGTQQAIIQAANLLGGCHSPVVIDDQRQEEWYLLSDLREMVAIVADLRFSDTEWARALAEVKGDLKLSRIDLRDLIDVRGSSVFYLNAEWNVIKLRV